MSGEVYVSSERFAWRLGFAAIGSVVGYSVLLCFAAFYHNFNTAGWAGLSGLLATCTFYLHWRARKRTLCSTDKLRLVSLIGLTFFILGLAGIAGYLAAGVALHQSKFMRSHH